MTGSQIAAPWPLQRPPRYCTGFTLIELLVTVAIVAVLASLVMPLAETAVRRNREQDLKYALRQIRTGIDAYKKAADEGRIPVTVGEPGYPKSLDLLVDGVEDRKDPKHRKIYFLRAIPRDPFSTDLSLQALDTWGKRSYQSSYDAPQEGDDVFDIYSQQPGTGLNGVPYREW